jgi:magnesium chelatase subunit H
MKPKRISAADRPTVRVALVTLDSHLADAAERAARALAEGGSKIAFSLHAVAEWNSDATARERCRIAIAEADIIIVSMLFMDEHVQAVMPWLAARRDSCDALVAIMSASEIVRLTRLGRFSMDASQGGAVGLLKRLRGSKGKGATAGARQLALVRQLPRILRFIPGTAQDLRAFFLTMQYWLAGSDRNLVNLVKLLIDRYAEGPRRALRGTLAVDPPIGYPEVGVYHPRLPGRIGDRKAKLPKPAGARGRIGLLLMRSYVLADNTAHYDAVIAALEARGFAVVPAFATGLDARAAVESFFVERGRPTIDALLSLTGFSLVGGPAYNDSKAAADMLAALDVPYLAAHPVEFQTLEQWRSSERGLTPIEATMMVAIPELDGATGPIVFGGRSEQAGSREMQPDPDRVAMLASRIERLVALRRKAPAERRVAIVIFNYPPDQGNAGTAAYLSVFESLHRTLAGMAAAGYRVAVPPSADALRERIIGGNAGRFGAQANVHARISADQHVRSEPYLAEIERQWGAAPGRHQTDGSSLFVLGESFGDVFVGVQPSFGYEGDPMRLLFEGGFAPTHAFSAFYRWLRDDFRADVVLHFGTHGALEFMPGKQTGLSGACWPDRLIGDLPNIYLYASNNPSEGLTAKRRAAATLVSYLTPPVARAGLYGALVELKDSIERWRGLGSEAAAERARLLTMMQAQAAALNLAPAAPAWAPDGSAPVAAIAHAIQELETTLIPDGLHVVGQPLSPAARRDLLLAIGESAHGRRPAEGAVDLLIGGASPEDVVAAHAGEQLDQMRVLATTDKLLSEDHELPAILRALDGRFIAPVPGGDLLRGTAVLPTGRNLYGFDPFRIPTAFAITEGAQQAECLLTRHREAGKPLPETVAIVLWGTDNLKTEGNPIGQALALLGARPRFDGFGRLAGATLIDLETLGRPRIDVLVTLSGIFRDLLPLQTRLLAEAAYLAASADEPAEFNFVRKHALEHQARLGCSLETAALRVFSNADGAYGANVNSLIESGRWDDESELAETYARRKCFAYGHQGGPTAQAALLQSLLKGVDIAYQNLDSVELGVTSIDHYFDTLGGISRAAQRARGESVPVYIGDSTTGRSVVRLLEEQVALETRTRVLNPKWYEGMLRHGYEGVRQIESCVTNTMGWSATTGQVAPWIYQEITQTFVLDPAMRERLSQLNPTASAKVAHRLLEAHERRYWSPDPETLAALARAGDELEDKLEGIDAMVAA